jgi:hypothetical protein
MKPIPKSLRCQACLGLGYLNDNNPPNTRDCYRCETCGIEYPELLKWLADPKNNPENIVISNGVHDMTPMLKVVEKWVFQKQPPYKWANIVTGSFRFGD